MAGKDVKVEIVGLYVFEHDVIARPVVAYISPESQKEQEQKAAGHPHTLTKRFVQTVVAQGEYREEEQKNEVWDGVTHEEGQLLASSASMALYWLTRLCR